MELIGNTIAGVRFVQDFLNLDKFKKLYYIEDGKKKSLEVGAYESQNFNLSNSITENPVEFGANLADSIYRNPTLLKVIIVVGDTQGLVSSLVDTVKDVTTGIINNGFLTTLGEQAYKLVDPDAVGNTRSGRVYNELIKIKNNFFPCELITRDRVYSNLQLKQINRNIAVNNYGGAVIEVDFQELLTFNTPDALTSVRNNGLLSLKEITSGTIARFTS